MSLQTSSTATPLQLLGMTNGLIIHQALYSAAKLGVADLLKDGAQTSSDLGYGNDSRQNGPFASNSQKPNALA